LTNDHYSPIDEINSSIGVVMFSRLPQLNSIRVFDSAARLSSFKAAALELNVTATAVSHQIRALEEKLGTLLFERKARLISLTPEGELLARVANRSLQQISDVVEEISNKDAVLTVCTTASFAAQWLVPKLENFHEHCSGIQVVIRTGEDLNDLFKDRRIDVALRYGQFDRNIEYSTKLVTECFGMFATRQYLQAHSKIEDATLIQTIWKNPILPAITWEQYFQNKDLNNKLLSVRNYDQEYHVIQAALAGQGIALVSSLLVKTALKQGWLEKHPKGETLEGLTYYMLTSEHHQNSLKVRVFRQWLLDEFSKDA